MTSAELSVYNDRMKNNYIIAALALVIVSAAGFFVYSSRQSAPDQMMVEDEDTAREPTTMQKDEKEPMKMDARYVPYAKGAIEGAAGMRRVLFFYASWCPTCRPADAEFTEEAARIPEDVTLIRINYNDPDTDQGEKTLAQKYGVTYQDTFVQIDEKGSEIAKWNGGKMDELLKNIK